MSRVPPYVESAVELRVCHGYTACLSSSRIRCVALNGSCSHRAWYSHQMPARGLMEVTQHRLKSGSCYTPTGVPLYPSEPAHGNMGADQSKRLARRLPRGRTPRVSFRCLGW